MTAPSIMRAPTRIDFGGGWTDVPPYSEREGGFVCATAIARYAVARLDAVDPSRRAAAARARSDTPLANAALRRAGLLGNVSLEVASDFPVGAGLGGSSAASAAILGAIDRFRDLPIDRNAIAERGRAIEVEDLGVPGGRQDHYCAVHGGTLALAFGRGVVVRQLALSATLHAELERRCILVYTGQSRVSGSTIAGVLEGYRSGDRRVTFALARMRDLAAEMAAALEDADVDGLGVLVGEHWTHQRSLHPAIPTPVIDELIAQTARAGALGAKASGASGGGCVLVVARDGLEDAVRHTAGALGQLVPFTLDEQGLTPCDWNEETR